MIYPLIKKMLFMMEPETAHVFAKRSASIIPKSILKKLTGVCSPRLKTKFGSVELKNPIGLAAGFDKNAEMLPFVEALGFGFAEIGSVTSQPSQGNPKPRIFRLPKDQSMINFMGLPNSGAGAISKRLATLKTNLPFIVNIAKTPPFANLSKISGIDDYLKTYQLLGDRGVATVLNLSCPNSGDGKTFEDPKLFQDLAEHVSQLKSTQKFKKPLLLKVSPTIEKSDLTKMIDVAIKYQFDGFVVSNTTTKWEGLLTKKMQLQKIGKGGLSGKALLRQSNEQLKHVYDAVGSKKVIIGVGGILSFADLLSKIALGALFFEVYTGLIYKGPFFIKQLCSELDVFCKREGIKNYQELVGQKVLR